jgi:hypothetical protein
MTPENFCYWLRGFIELSGDDAELSPEQVKMINEHLDLVLKKVTNPLQTAPTSTTTNKFIIKDHYVPRIDETWVRDPQPHLSPQTFCISEITSDNIKLC